MPTYINSMHYGMDMSTAVSDLVLLLDQKWMPKDRRKAIKRILVDMVDRMEDSSNLEDLR